MSASGIRIADGQIARDVLSGAIRLPVVHFASLQSERHLAESVTTMLN